LAGPRRIVLVAELLAQMARLDRRRRNCRKGKEQAQANDNRCRAGCDWSPVLLVQVCKDIGMRRFCLQSGDIDCMYCYYVNDLLRLLLPIFDRRVPGFLCYL
jgi:hypothetical protein